MIKSAFKAGGDRIVPTTLLKSPVRLYTLIRQLKWQTHIKDKNRQMSGLKPTLLSYHLFLYLSILVNGIKILRNLEFLGDNLNVLTKQASH